MIQLPTRRVSGAPEWAREHLGDLAVGSWEPSGWRGGQSAADEALAAFDARGYAAGRNEVWPVEPRETVAE